MRIFPNNNDRWFVVLFRWELLRVIYNLVMIIAGGISVALASVTIPLVYLVIGVGLNIVYSFLWVVDLSIINKNGKSKSKTIFKYYTGLSIGLVFGFSFFILMTMYGG